MKLVLQITNQSIRQVGIFAKQIKRYRDRKLHLIEYRKWIHLFISSLTKVSISKSANMSVHKFIPFTCLFISASVHLPTQQPSSPAIRPGGINGERHLKTASRKNEQIYSRSGQFWVDTDFYSHCDTPEQLPKAYLHPEKMPKPSQRTLLQPLQSFPPNHPDRVRTAKHVRVTAVQAWNLPYWCPNLTP